MFSSGSIGAAGATIGTLYAGNAITTNITTSNILTNICNIGGKYANGMLTLIGSSSSVNGPHIHTFTVDDTTYPVFQQLNWSRDNISLNFDYYYDGVWRTSSINTGYQIYKLNNALLFNYANGSAGSSSGFFTALCVGSTGNVGINNIVPQTTLDISGSTRISGTISAGTLVGTLFSSGSFGTPGATIGTVYATSITSASAQISGTISAGTHVGTLFSSGSFGAGGATIGTVYANIITSGTAQISGTISAGTHVGSLFSSGSIGASGATVGTVYAITVTSASAQISGTISAATLVGSLFSSGSFGAAGATIGTLYTNIITSGTAQISGTISAGTLVGNLFSSGSIGASGATIGTVYATSAQISGTISAGTLVGTLFSSGSFGTPGATIGTVYATTVTSASAQISGTISAGTHVGSLFSSGSIGASGATVGTVYATTVTSSNAQISGTISAGTHVGTLFSSGSIGAGGATIGTVYATSITSTSAQISGTISAGNLNISTGTVYRMDINGNDPLSGLWLNGALIRSTVDSFFDISLPGSKNIFSADPDQNITFPFRISAGSIGASGATIGNLYNSMLSVNTSNTFSNAIRIGYNTTRGQLLYERSDGTPVVSTYIDISNNFNLSNISATNGDINIRPSTTSTTGGSILIFGKSKDSTSSTFGILVLNNGGLAIKTTADATSITSGGGATIAGGVSIGKSLYAGSLTVSGDSILTGTTSTGSLVSTSLITSNFSTANAQISGTISTGTLVGTLLSSGSIGASGATIGTVYATTITSASAQISGTISAGTHVGSLFSSGSFGAGGATIGTVYATTITSGTARITNISTGSRFDLSNSYFSEGAYLDLYPKGGTFWIQGNAQVFGNLAKSSGTFDIQHPLEEMANNGHRLIHSFIEGPRCDLIYRGKVQLVNGSAIVNIDQDCVAETDSAMTSGTFDALVANPQIFLQNNINFDRLIGTITGGNLTITCENTNSNNIVEWMVIGERKDHYIKTWDKTNSNGYLVTQYKN